LEPPISSENISAVQQGRGAKVKLFSIPETDLRLWAAVKDKGL